MPLVPDRGSGYLTIRNLCGGKGVNRRNPDAAMTSRLTKRVNVWGTCSFCKIYVAGLSGSVLIRRWWSW
jgi:hypothetical protein